LVHCQGSLPIREFTPGVNFINILLVASLYENVMSNFLYVQFVSIFWQMETVLFNKVLLKCWWNGLLDTSQGFLFIYYKLPLFLSQNLNRIPLYNKRLILIEFKARNNNCIIMQMMSPNMVMHYSTFICLGF